MHFNQVYADIFLEFKDEAVQQVMVQWVRLFPVVRLRVSEQRLIDRLDLILRNLHSKYTKIPKTSLVVSTLEETIEKLRSVEFQQECRAFMESKNGPIMARELEIDQKEQDE